MVTTWTIAVDWQRTGDFTGTNDNITSHVLEANWFIGFKKPYEDVAQDTMLKLTLNNADKRFSPENGSSPLAVSLVPFHPVRVQSNDGTTTHTHYSGWIESISPSQIFLCFLYIAVHACLPIHCHSIYKTQEIQKGRKFT